MYKLFQKSTNAAISIEMALVTAVVFPAIYMLILLFGMGFVFSGRVVETTRNLADFVAKYDNWALDATGVNSLPLQVAAYNNIIEYKFTYSASPAFDVAPYNKAHFNHKIIAAYISSNTMNICATMTYTDPLASGTLPSTAPQLDAVNLTGDGPVWVVQTAYTYRKVNFTHLAVRRPTTVNMMLSKAGVSYVCSPTMAALSYP